MGRERHTSEDTVEEGVNLASNLLHNGGQFLNVAGQGSNVVCGEGGDGVRGLVDDIGCCGVEGASDATQSREDFGKKGLDFAVDGSGSVV